MVHIFLAVGDPHRGRCAVAHEGQLARQVGIQHLQHLRRPRPRQGHDDGIKIRRGFPADHLPRSAGDAPDAVHGDADTQRLSRQTPHQFLSQRLQAALQGGEHAVAGAAGLAAAIASGGTAPGAEPHGLEQAAMALLQVPEARKRRQQRQPHRVAAINGADHRLGHGLERFASQAALHELSQRLVLIASAAWYHQVQPHPQLAQRRHQRRGHQRPDARRGHQVEPLGGGMQPAPADDEAAPVLVLGADDLPCHAQTLNQLQGPGLLGDERVRALFHEKALPIHGADDSAQAAAGLIKRHLWLTALLPAQLQQVMRCRQTGDAAADDGDATGGCVHRVSPESRMSRSPSMSRNAGWPLTQPARCSSSPQEAAVALASTSRS